MTTTAAASAVVDSLRARIAAVDGWQMAAGRTAECADVPLGLAAIDEALPWGGLPKGGLHEVLAGDDSGAATAFAVRLLGRAGSGAVVWCGRRAELYAPGLAALGLDPARLLVVLTAAERDVGWAMEEALRCRAVAAVLGETRMAEPVALRRLQLAAETAGTMAIVLRPAGFVVSASPAVSRWRVAAAAGGARFPAGRWRIALERVRGGATGHWCVDVDDATGDLRLAADFRDGSPVRSVVGAAAVAG